MSTSTFTASPFIDAVTDTVDGRREGTLGEAARFASPLTVIRSDSCTGFLPADGMGEERGAAGRADWSAGLLGFLACRELNVVGIARRRS